MNSKFEQTNDDSPPDRRTAILRKIQHLFTKLSIDFAIGKSLRFTDNNIAIESVMGILLNAVYGWNLQLQNKGSSDQAGYDLYDEKLGIAVDVTTRKRREKTQKSLDKLTKPGGNKVKEFYIFYPKVRDDDRTHDFNKEFRTSLPFDLKRNIINLNTLIEEIRDRDVERLQEFLDLFGTQLRDPDLISTTTKIQNRIVDYIAQLRGQCEAIPTVGPRDEPLLPSNSLEPEFHEDHSTAGSEKRPILRISDLLNSKGNFAISASAGAGKSVSLRLLLWQIVNRPSSVDSEGEARILPLYFDYPPSDIAAAVTSRLALIFGTSLDISLLEFSKYVEVTMILDAIDEGGNSSAIEDAIISFAKQFPNIRVFLGVRSCSQRIASAFKRLDLRPLSNFRMQRYLCQLFGPERSSMIFNTLELHGNIENFRNPLMCVFLRSAFDSSGSSASDRIFKFYEKSIVGFLSEMQSKANRSSLASVHIDELMIFLGAVGFAMVSKGDRLLTGQATQNIWRIATRNQSHRTFSDDLPKYLELAVLGGVVTSSAAGISFTHDTIRQFFAAFHLSSMPAKRWPLTIFWCDRWHQVAVFLVAALDESVAIPILRRLTKSVRWCAKIGALHVSFGANRIFLTLKLLAQFGDATRDLKEFTVGELQAIGPGQLFLNRKASEGSNSEFLQCTDNRYDEFFSLIGAFGHEISASLLESYRGYYHRRVLKGYVRFASPYRTQHVVNILLASEGEAEDGTFRHYAAEYLVRNADIESLQLIKKILLDCPFSQVVSLLDRISWGFCSLRDLEDSEEKESVKKLFKSVLLDNLVGFLLHHPDDTVRELVLRVLRHLGDEFLPQEAVMACCNSVQMENPNHNAIWPLIYARDPESPSIIAEMIQRCSLSHVDCAEMGLSVLRRRHEGLFLVSFQHFLACYSGNYIDWLSGQSTGVSESLSIPEGREYANLLFGIFFPLGSIRFIAWWTILCLDNGEPSREVQVIAIDRCFSDDNPNVRRLILDKMLELGRPDALELAVRGLADDSSGVNRVSLNYFRDNPEIHISDSTLSLIKSLSGSDKTDWNVPYNAQQLLERIRINEAAKIEVDRAPSLSAE